MLQQNEKAKENELPEFQSKIKKLRPNLQVVVMSAQNTVLTAVRASQRGAFDYLPKPFDLVELTNIVKTL